MKFSAFAGLTLGVGIALFSVPVLAQEGEVGQEDPMQDYNDSQFCAALLIKLGGAENQQKSERALAHAREIAPIVGDDSDEKFDTSYNQLSEILDLASEDEMENFTKLCVEKW